MYISKQNVITWRANPNLHYIYICIKFKMSRGYTDLNCGSCFSFELAEKDRHLFQNVSSTNPQYYHIKLSLLKNAITYSAVSISTI